MRKKGLSYVDWAMSVAIFIVYAVILFFIFKPSLQQDYSEDYLSAIIKTGIEDDAYYSMSKIPVFVNLTAEEGEYQIVIPNFPFDYYFGNVIMAYQNGSWVRRANVVYPYLKFDADLQNETINVFYLYHNLERNYSVLPVSGPILNESNFTYHIGLKQEISGLHYHKLNRTLNSTDYEDLKDRWNYPLTKEFSIYLFEGVDITTPFLTYEEIYPGQERVGVLQYSDWVLLDDTSRRVITVRIRTW